MPAAKFGELERDPVIRAVATLLNVTLRPVGNYRKWLRDDSGRNFWILGGRDHWHGISEEMMNAEVAASMEGQLFIAIQEKQRIVVFGSSTATLVSARHLLPRARESNNDFQFKCTIRGAHLVVDQVPAVLLSRLVDLSFDEGARQLSSRKREAKKLLKLLSPTERDELITRLRDEV